jgi:hypothetical protein
MGKHALLSASSSHRWIHCPPSARLEETFENTTSIFAEEGTAAHELAEHKLRKFLGQQTQRPVSEFDSEELEYYTDIYLDFAVELITDVKGKCKDPSILIEQRLDYSCYAPEGFGTGDLIIVADGTLDIVDLKYGKGVLVSAEENPQMKLYALGALNLFDSLYDIQRVRMTICQPRLENISTYETSVEELTSWAEKELRPKAQLAIKGEGEFLAGEHCRFCRARQTCRARADSNLEIAKYDFKLPALLTDSEITEVLNIADKLSAWASDVYDYAADKTITQGKVWQGYKLVEGRSNRRYTSESAVIETVTAAGYTDIYKTSLIGITDMEKLLGKKRFIELLGKFVEKPKGKPTLVPDSDKRQAIKMNNTAKADFKEEK